MKKTTVYILALVLCLSLLCACGDRNNGKPVTTPAPTDNAAGPNGGNVNDNDGIITDDDNGVLGGDHDDTNGVDDRNNGGAVGDIIDGDTPDMPEPNVSDNAGANGGAGTSSGNVSGNGSTGSRRARLR